MRGIATTKAVAVTKAVAAVTVAANAAAASAAADAVSTAPTEDRDEFGFTNHEHLEYVCDFLMVHTKYKPFMSEALKMSKSGLTHQEWIPRLEALLCARSASAPLALPSAGAAVGAAAAGCASGAVTAPSVVQHDPQEAALRRRHNLLCEILNKDRQRDRPFYLRRPASVDDKKQLLELLRKSTVESNEEILYKFCSIIRYDEWSDKKDEKRKIRDQIDSYFNDN